MHEADAEILEHLKRTRAKTLALFGNVPEEFLDRTPLGEEYNLAFLLAHTACSGSWWLHNVLKDNGPEEHPRPSDKESLIRIGEESLERLLAFFEADDGANMGRTFPFVDHNGETREWTGRNRLLYLIDHEVHHRGKLTLALRQYGLMDIPFIPF